MRSPFLSIGLAAAIAWGTSRALADADCEPTPERGPSFGLRLAYAFPDGALTRLESLNSNITGMVPFWFDAGYRTSRALYVGPYFQLAPAFVASDVCPKNLSCSAYELRAGVNVQLHLKWMMHSSATLGPFDPWIGLGTGYERATVYVSTASGAKSHETNDGFEFLNVQLGTDHVAGPLHLGFFAAISLAEFFRQEKTTGTTSAAFAIPEPRLHGWFSLGVRGQYDL
jgi:hypothetical protein